MRYEIDWTEFTITQDAQGVHLSPVKVHLQGPEGSGEWDLRELADGTIATLATAIAKAALAAVPTAATVQVRRDISDERHVHVVDAKGRSSTLPIGGAGFLAACRDLVATPDNPVGIRVAAPPTAEDVSAGAPAPLTTFRL